jgi:Na+/H+ antiporter NhaD/arsenite permease-like protein
VIDYVPFILMLWALFTVAGGIHLSGTLRCTTGVNVTLLATGMLLASWIGTTGASMVMIRPVLRANASRRHRTHVVCFFIFLVANVGGALTPLGDPPLFLGFLHGVPFFWVTRALLLPMLTVSAVLLAAFAWLDARLLRQEAPASTSAAAAPVKPEPLRLEGAHNLAFLLAIMGAVLFSGSVRLGEIPLFGHVHLEIQNLLRDAALIAIGLLSLKTTPKAVRAKNEFGWGPMREVAILFAGIFLTIVPALRILQAGEHGALASLVRAVRDPAHYFWASGGLSSFLDNAPTYLTFVSTVLGSLGLPESAVSGLLDRMNPGLYNAQFARILEAVSAGSVFMGANSYIGNAPNFMVKSIAEEAGVPMPSFFGYIFRYTIPFLLPSFVIVTLLFFRA